jgi:hypothetical protein
MARTLTEPPQTARCSLSDRYGDKTDPRQPFGPHLDNHSAHISKETNAWLATQPEGRFSFVFTPKHASWLNLVEGFFSKMARSMLRHIGVASKAELKARILAYLDDINADPVVHIWTYKIGEAA